MSLAINELSFFGCVDKYKMLDAIDKLLVVLKRLNTDFDIGIHDIYGCKMDMSLMIDNNITISQFLSVISDREKRRILLSLFQHTRKIECGDVKLKFDSREAVGASYVFRNDGVLLSAQSSDAFSQAYVVFEKDKKTVKVRNLSKNEDIPEHADHIVVRFYEKT